MSALLTALWAFLKSPAGRRLFAVVGLILIAALIYQGGVSAGVDRERAAQATRLAAAKPAIERVQAGGAAITAATQAETQAATEHIKVVYRDLIKEVPAYVTPEADRRCDLPVGFVRLHDQAAAGLPAVSAPAGDVRDAPSGIPLSAASATIVDNYGVAYQWRERAIACETWAVQQADLWTKNIRTAPPP